MGVNTAMIMEKPEPKHAKPCRISRKTLEKEGKLHYGHDLFVKLCKFSSFSFHSCHSSYVDFQAWFQCSLSHQSGRSIELHQWGLSCLSRLPKDHHFLHQKMIKKMHFWTTPGRTNLYLKKSSHLISQRRLILILMLDKKIQDTKISWQWNIVKPSSLGGKDCNILIYIAYFIERMWFSVSLLSLLFSVKRDGVAKAPKIKDSRKAQWISWAPHWIFDQPAI